MIRHLQNQQVTLYSKTSLNRYGRENVGSGATHYVRFQEVSKTKFLPTGETIQIIAIAYFDRAVTINLNDRVDYDSVSYKVWSKAVARGMDGNAHHIKVELTKWQST